MMISLGAVREKALMEEVQGEPYPGILQAKFWLRVLPVWVFPDKSQLEI
ncbi:MAG: hypothetical protein WCO26_11330 [Deltaproteobacteria bacterium]